LIGFSARALEPQSGWWWNPAEPGRGYFIEVKNGSAFAASYLYDGNGQPVWYVTGPSVYNGNGFVGTLGAYNGGQTLTGAYKTPAGPVPSGNVSFTFADATHGTITWPGGSIPIVRYEIAENSLSAPAPAFRPETGWWWNASEGGRGFSIEIQGDDMFVAGFMYDVSGSPVWYVSGGKMTTPGNYHGQWLQYGNGQTLTGAWREASVTNPNIGSAVLSFDSATTAWLQLPDRRNVRLTRFQFTAPEVRDTVFGKVVGKLDSANGAYAWLGIPYAAPPVGNLRWRAPVDPSPWNAARQATDFGNACVQSGSTLGPPPAGQTFGASMSQNFGRTVGSEDCLTLNVWAPASGETGLPVVMFIYGGSNIVGWSGTPDYAGARLAGEQKVVFVSVNYRLNLFGFLNYTALKTADMLSDSGNFATLDLIQALKFIKNNIAAFGGDPSNVTIAGQSAGAQNVWSLIVSPQAAGLFHKAVPISAGQSGATQTAGELFAMNLVRQLLIDEGKATDASSADAYIAANLAADSARRAYLYSKSADALMTAFGKSTVSNSFARLFYDGTVQPSNSSAAFSGTFLNNVPVLAGAANEEGKYWGPTYFSNGLSSTQLWAYRWNFNPDNPASTPVAVSDIISAQYLPANRSFSSCFDTGYNAVTLNSAYFSTPCGNSAYNTTYFWWWQSNTLARYAPLQPKTYAYNFAWSRQPEPWRTVYGAAHIADIPFLFGNFAPGLFSSGYSSANRSGREALSLRMRQSLAAFMRTGNPNHAALGATWLPWSTTAGGAKRLVFDATDSSAVVSQSTSDVPIVRP